MKCHNAIFFLIVLIMVSCNIVFAEVYGKWDSSENSCNCNVSLIIGMYEDGSPAGTMNCGARIFNLYNILLDGDHISFSVDQSDDNETLAFDYDAEVHGDSMTGTYENEETPSNSLAFSAKRHKNNQDPSSSDTSLEGSDQQRR